MAQTCLGFSARFAPTFRPAFHARRSDAAGSNSEIPIILLQWPGWPKDKLGWRRRQYLRTAGFDPSWTQPRQTGDPESGRSELGGVSGGLRAALRQPLRASLCSGAAPVSDGAFLRALANCIVDLTMEGVERATRPNDGSKKAGRRTPSKPSNGLVFLRATRSGRVPLPGRIPMIAMELAALPISQAPDSAGERLRRGLPRSPGPHPRRPVQKLRQPDAARYEEGGPYRSAIWSRQADPPWPLDFRAWAARVQPQPIVHAHPPRRGESLRRASSLTRLRDSMKPLKPSSRPGVFVREH